MTTDTSETLAETDADAVTRARDLNAEVLHLTRSMHVLKNTAAQTAGVPWSTYLLLFHLIAGGPRRSSALAEVACTDPSTISRQVDVLVRRGLVERQADPDDGRASLLVATAAGVAQQERMRDARDAMMLGVLDGWSDDDVRHLTHLMGRLNADLSAQLPQIVASVQRRTALADPLDPTKDHS